MLEVTQAMILVTLTQILRESLNMLERCSNRVTGLIIEPLSLLKYSLLATENKSCLKLNGTLLLESIPTIKPKQTNERKFTTHAIELRKDINGLTNACETTQCMCGSCLGRRYFAKTAIPMGLTTRDGREIRTSLKFPEFYTHPTNRAR